MFKKYDEEFKKDFRDEIMFLNFSQNKEKKRK
jgi:hypothetical protein